MAAASAVVRVLNARELEVPLPIRPLLVEGRRAIADLDPLDRAVLSYTCRAHVAQILAFGDGAASEALPLDGFEQRLVSTWAHARANEVTHLPARVLRVADLLEPNGGRRVAVCERALRELAVGRRAVPMLDVRRGVERLAGRELVQGATTLLHASATLL